MIAAPTPAQSPVLLLGAGRLGIELTVQLLHSTARPIWLWNRSALPENRQRWLADGLIQLPPDAHTRLTFLSGPLADLPASWLTDPCLILLTVVDDALPSLSQALVAARALRLSPDQKPAPVAHTSGALSTQVLQALAEDGWSVGAVHPLQSFSGTAIPGSIEGTWFALEGSAPVTEPAEALVKALQGRAVSLKPGGKMYYHAAAVMASNLLVSLAGMAVELMNEAVTPPADASKSLEILLPLIEGTVQNLRRRGLPHALTGPVSRGDAGVVARQLQALLSLDAERRTSGPAEASAPAEASTPAEASAPHVSSAPAVGAAQTPFQCLTSDDTPAFAAVYQQLSLKAVALAQARGLPENSEKALLKALHPADKA